MMFFDCFVKINVFKISVKSIENLIKVRRINSCHEKSFKSVVINRITIKKFIKNTITPTNFPNQLL